MVSQKVTVLQHSPGEGLRSGGTEMEVRGENLDVGNGVSVSMSDQECRVIELTERRLRFLTAPQSPDATSASTTIVIRHDGEEEHNIKFQYIDDPSVTSVEQTTALVSGGVDVIFNGNNLNVAKLAVMTLRMMGSVQSAARRRRRHVNQSARSTRDLDVISLDERSIEDPAYDVEGESQVEIVCQH